jgi:hypothetical protein
MAEENSDVVAILSKVMLNMEGTTLPSALCPRGSGAGAVEQERGIDKRTRCGVNSKIMPPKHGQKKPNVA